MNSSTISADIISFTSLADEDKRKIELQIKLLISELTDKYKDDGFFGRIIQGDYIECAMNSPVHAMRIALLLKTLVKSFELSQNTKNIKRTKYFKEYGIRIAVAVAPLVILDSKNGIIDGEAIYLSGRAIKELSTSDKQKVVIKSSMFFCSPDKHEQNKYDTMVSLLDNIISRCSSKQCEVLHYKLLGTSEKDISLKLNRNQSTISQHSTAVGWNAIEKTVNYFENNIK
jgi:hypothetical protein